MVNNSIITTDGKNTLLYRGFTNNGSLSAVSNLSPELFKIGINNADITISDTILTFSVPVTTGTINDTGANTLTGSTGGDNTTDNIVTFKQATGTTDNKAQNLIANDTNVSKIWTKASLTSAIVTTKPFALWFYIKGNALTDTTTYDKFKTTGTALEIRFRTTGDAANKYYSYPRTKAQITYGWNWITSNTVLVSALTEGAGGVPSGAINELVIIVTTNNATDTFVAGDVIYDVLRQWATSDLVKVFTTGYPSFDTSLNQTTIRCYLNSLEGLGFLIDSFALVNQDTVPKIMNIVKMEGQSKSITDEFLFIVVNRII